MVSPCQFVSGARSSLRISTRYLLNLGQPKSTAKFLVSEMVEINFALLELFFASLWTNSN